MPNPTHYFTADTHLGHRRVIEMSNRPFGSIEEHDQAIIDGITDTLRPGDYLWHLGDVAFSPTIFVAFLLSMQQAGINVNLIRGNHDDKIAWKHRGRFHAAHESLYHRFPDPIRGEGKIRVQLSHYAHRTWRNSVHGSFHFFGHSHGSLPDYNRSTDVGVDCWGYKPVSLTTLINKLEGNQVTNHHPEPEIPASFHEALEDVREGRILEVDTAHYAPHYTVTLPNGRKYKVTNTGSPYVGGEYPSGGYIIHSWLPKVDGGLWIYVDHSPDQECLDSFFQAAARNQPDPS